MAMLPSSDTSGYDDSAAHGLPPQVANLADLIMRYVQARPDACDTVEGVSEWWVPTQRHFDRLRDVLAALQWLQAAGRIHARIGADGRSLYAGRSDPT
jgi:hypothetical protein